MSHLLNDHPDWPNAMTTHPCDGLSVEQIIHRLFRPEKYPEFHAALDNIHEEWIKRMRTYTEKP
mgnify:CR=1 FL=1